MADTFRRYHPDDQGTVRDAFDRAVSEGEPYDEVVRLDTDDERRWIRARADPELSGGEVVCIRGIFQDITALKQREEQFEALHDASRELMAATSRREVAQISLDAAKDILGLTGVRPVARG